MRIVLAEDPALLREGLMMVLKHLGHEIVALAVSAPELVQAVHEHHAQAPLDIVITDVRMPPTHTSDGLEAAAELRSSYPNLPILVLSQYIAAAYARELFSSGANGLGYLLKDRVGDIEEFARAIDTVATGGTVLDPDVVTHLMNSAAQKSAGRLASLSPREREILELMAQGLSNREIEEKLVVTAPTVSKHIGNIFDKLGLQPDEGNRRVRAVLAYLGQDAA